jgi:hypothetical protein
VFFLALSSEAAPGMVIPPLSGSFSRNTAIVLISAGLFHGLWQLFIVVVPTGIKGVAFETAAPEFFTLLSSSQQTGE